MGGVISLYIASLFPIDGYIIGGTVLKFKNPFETNFLVPLLCKIIKSQPKKKQLKSKNIKFYGYSEYPLIALNEFRKIKDKSSKFKKKNFPGIFTHLMFMILHGQLILNIFMIFFQGRIMLIFIFFTLITLNIIINGKNCSPKLLN